MKALPHFRPKAFAANVLSGAIRSRRIFLNSRRLRGKSYLNVGCGRNIKPEFINLEYTWQPGIDVCWDITKGLPLPSGSMRGIFTEHCLEHITYFQCIDVLKEFLRVLTPGGTLRIIVPNGGEYLNLYSKARAGEAVEFPYLGKGGEADLKEDSSIGFTPMMAVNRIFRGYGHQFAYDGPTFVTMLRHVGFADARQTSYMVGNDPNLLIDSEYRAPQSLYVEAVRPA